MNFINKRSRTWFLCINKNAECFNNLASILNQQQNVIYAYILHDKDVQTKADENRILKNIGFGYDDDLEVMKEVHYHVVLCYENARTWSSVSNTFKGGHVEVSHSIADCTAYLLHSTPQAVLEGKYQYNKEDIITNNMSAVSVWLNQKSLQFEIFDENLIIKYIIFDNCTNIFDFYQKFGVAIKNYVALIKELLFGLSVSKDENEIALNFVRTLDITGIQQIRKEYYMNTTTCYINIYEKRYRLIDLIIKYECWQFLDCEGVQAVYDNERLRIRFHLEEIKGFNWEFIKEKLLAYKNQCIY